MLGSSPFASSPLAAESGFIELEATLAVQESGSDTYVGVLKATTGCVLTVKEAGVKDTASGSTVVSINASAASNETLTLDTFQSNLITFRNFTLAVSEVGTDTFSGLLTVTTDNTLIISAIWAVQEENKSDILRIGAIVDLEKKRARAVRLVGKPLVSVNIVGKPIEITSLIGRPSAATSILG